MAILVLKAIYFKVKTVDLRDHVQEVSMDLDKTVEDTTCYGSNSKTKILGLADSKIPVTFLQDYAAAKTDATLWDMWKNETAATVVLRPLTDAASATNPEYEVSVLLPSYSPIKGKVGDLATVQVTFEGTGDVTRTIT